MTLHVRAVSGEQRVYVCSYSDRSFDFQSQWQVDGSEKRSHAFAQFALPSSVGDCTRVVRKATSVRMSGLVLLLRQSNFATKEWKRFASGIESGGDSPTSKRFSQAGVVEKLASPNSFIRSNMNPGFPIITTPGCWKFAIIPRYRCLSPLVTLTLSDFLINTSYSFSQPSLNTHVANRSSA